MWNNIFFENRDSYERLEKCGGAREATDDNIIRRMRFACWITKATHIYTIRIYNSYCVSTTTVFTPTRPSGTLYVYLPVSFCTYHQENAYFSGLHGTCKNPGAIYC